MSYNPKLIYREKEEAVLYLDWDGNFVRFENKKGLWYRLVCKFPSFTGNRRYVHLEVEEVNLGSCLNGCDKRGLVECVGGLEI